MEEALQLAIIRAKEWQSAQSLQPQTQSTTQLTRQINQTSSTSLSGKCFSDASWKIGGLAGIGWIFKDSQDVTLQEGSAPISFAGSPLIAEAMATLAAVGVALESDYKNLFFASDSMILVKVLNLKIQQKELHGILHDILHLSLNFNVCSFNFISRSLNHQADLLAKAALLSPL
ncbi:putative ribonuclease H domain-containing protein [Arabidopsis thaliana]